MCDSQCNRNYTATYLLRGKGEIVRQELTAAIGDFAAGKPHGVKGHVYRLRVTRSCRGVGC